jgi:hypothetical protein
MPAALELNPPSLMLAYLDVLVLTGLYGTDRAECAERLIAQSIEDKMHGPIAQELRTALERR